MRLRVERRSAAERRGEIEAEAVPTWNTSTSNAAIHDHTAARADAQLQRIAGPV